jgi:hypothetical protein
MISYRPRCRYWLRSWNQIVRGSQKSLVALVRLKAKTSYCRRRIKLIVERLEAGRKELDIGIKAEQKEVKSNIKVAKKLDIKGKLDIDWLNIALKATSTESKLKVKDSS